MRRFVATLAQRSRMLYAIWACWRMVRIGLKLRIHFANRPRDSFLVPTHTITVAPARIRHRRGFTNFAGRRRVPTILPGDWDITSGAIDAHGFYDDLRAVAAGAEWHSTRVYESAMEALEREEPTWHECTSALQFEQEWCNRYDCILESIKRDGYLSQTQLRKSRADGRLPYLAGEVTLAIGRDGALIALEGRHRVQCATVLGVQEIPAMVVIRHAEWATFRNRLESYARAHGGTVREPLLHPDLVNIPAPRDYLSGFEKIRSALATRNGRLIDLAPGWGGFCQLFEHAGFVCTAVLDKSEDEYFLRANRRAQDSVFDVVTPTDLPRSRSFDVALALDWTRPDQQLATDRDRLFGLIGALDISELAFEIPLCLVAEPPEVSPHEATLLKEVAAQGGFATWSLIGERDSRRVIYRFSRYPGH